MSPLSARNSKLTSRFGPSPLPSSFEDFDANMRTNVRGAILTTQYLLPLVRKSQAKQIFWISSVVASFAGFYSETAAGVACASPQRLSPPRYTLLTPWHADAMSKSALNMYGLKVSRELASDGFTCVLVHPGYVKTDMVRIPGLPVPLPSSLGPIARRTRSTTAVTSRPRRPSLSRASPVSFSPRCITCSLLHVL